MTTHTSEVAKIVAYVAAKDERMARLHPDPRLANAAWAASLPEGVTLEVARPIIDRYYKQTRWDGSRLDLLGPDAIAERVRERARRDENARRGREPRQGVPMPEWFRAKHADLLRQADELQKGHHDG